MRVLVFGANGRVGSKVVARLLRDNHQVRAFVHSGVNLPTDHNLQVIEGDVHDSQSVSDALKDQQAVISALGSWGTESKDILSSAMQNIVPAMQKASIQRIISVTGSGAIALGDRPSLIDKLNRGLIRLAASKILEDGESHIAILAASNLDWTVIRSPAMHNSTSRLYTLSNHAPAPWARISRDAVADAMVDLISDAAWLQAAPHITQR